MKQPPISNLDWYCKVHCKTKLSAVILYRLADALSEAGFTSGEIEKIFWRNVMRVYAEVLG